jgi:hypothetical protein
MAPTDKELQKYHLTRWEWDVAMKVLAILETLPERKRQGVIDQVIETLDRDAKRILRRL